ncbi:MAG: hypothetical protein E7616_04300 [Ruminococcaceae bacterium]|nr:hypothetical protein [Oscillospiraceae bacterium]
MKKRNRFLSIILAVMMVIPLFTGIFSYVVAAEPTNVALGKTVIASGTNPQAINDGNVNNYWDGGAYPNSATIDLGDYYRLSSLKMINYHDGNRYYHYNIEVSDNGRTYTKVATKDSNSKATESGDVFDGLDVVARYIRINMTYNSANIAVHIKEFEAYGVLEPDYVPVVDPNAKDPEDENNIAYGKGTRAGANDAMSGMVVDGNTTTAWSASDMPFHVDVDLGKLYDLTEIIVYLPVTTNPCSYNVYVSDDALNFDKIVSVTEQVPDADGDTHSVNVTARFVRVLVTAVGQGAGGTSRVSEIRVHGTESEKENLPVRTEMEFISYTDWLNANYGLNLQEGKYNIDDTYTKEDTVEALQGLITRVLGSEYVSWFTFDITAKDGLDTYTLSDSDGKIKITANTGVAAAAGLNYYLKYYCNVHVSQQTSQVNMPAEVVKLGKTITNTTNSEVRYAYNYCTLSYTMPFYGYEDWQRELDYLMLSGVNLILDTTATEALWVYYLQQYGYTADDALAFVCGYAYKAWWLMGNLEGYGGPVSDQWVIDTLELARVNQRYMTVMGAEPCLQGYMGALPNNIADKAQKTLTEMGFSSIKDSLVPQGGWASFLRPILCKTNYDGYEKMAKDFYAAQEYLYGPVTDYYAGDLAHEGGVLPTDMSRAEMSATILGHMMDADADAVWVMQSWHGNPNLEVLKGFGDAREEHVIILDLNATSSPGWENTTSWNGKEFGGTGWVYCMLDNFGGRPGMHGDLSIMMNSIVKAVTTGKTFKGIGLTSEATQMNPICQELLWEMAWRNEAVDLDEWVESYINRRYGVESESAKQAWAILSDLVYNYSGYHTFNLNSVVNLYPGFNPSSISGNLSPDYDPIEMEKAAELLMKDFDKLVTSECYVYDLVDLFKQILSNSQYGYFKVATRAYNAEDAANFTKFKNKFLESVLLMDEVCTYEKDSTITRWLGRVDEWINDERTGEYGDFTRDMMRYNAKLLITAWCSGSLHNYAYRQYSGMLKDNNYVMWKAFFDSLEKGLNTGSANTPANSFYFNTQWNWAVSDKEYNEEIPAAIGLKEIYETIKNDHGYAQTKGIRIVDSNIANKGTAYASSSGAGPASNVNDGNTGTLWIAGSKSTPAYVGIKFDEATEITGIKVIGEPRNPLGIDDNPYYIEALIDGEYVKIDEGSMYNDEFECYATIFTFDETIVTTDIRVTITETKGMAWPAIAELKVYTDAENVETTAQKLTITPYASGWENWKNSPNNPAGVGNGLGVTELLLVIKGATVDMMLDWELTLDDGTTKKTIKLAPATADSDNALYRFETCEATGENQFIPKKGTTYTVTVKVYDGDLLLYEGTGTGFNCNMDPVVGGKYYEGEDGPTPGDPTPGDPTPGDPTPGDPTPGDPTPGDPTPGDPTPGDPTPDDPTVDDNKPAGKPAQEGGFPVWAIILIVVAVIAIAGVAVVVLKKKKN